MKLYAMNLLYRVFKVKSRGSEIRAQVNTLFKLSTIAGHFHFNVSYKPHSELFVLRIPSPQCNIKMPTDIGNDKITFMQKKLNWNET